jgi:hydrogenase expression/formation protein HypD
MEVCGTHTAAIRKFGIKNIIPESIELISGPGCPVCVTSDGYLRNVGSLIKKYNVTVATYSDMLRVPFDGMSLEVLRAKGADIVGVNSALEALDVAKNFSRKEVVFLGVGFETTAPGTAIAVQMAQKERVKNFSVYSAHKTIPEALLALGRDKDLKLDGFLLPGHVSAILGLIGYRSVMKKIGLSSVVSGFEALDILFSIYKIVRSVNHKTCILENEYSRIVGAQGNPKAKKILEEVFEKKDGFWRGLGVIKDSELALRSRYKIFDAAKKFSLASEKETKERAAKCRCADVLKGKISPQLCRFFGKSCTPEAPLGPCMVSQEGTCRAFFEYR